MLLERGPPGHEAEAQPVIYHGEPAAEKLRRTDQLAADIVAGNGGPPFPSTLGRERRAGTLDVADLEPLDQVSRCSDPAVAKVRGISLVSQPSPAPIQCRLHLSAEPLIGQDGALPGRQLAVKPGGAVVAGLLLHAHGRKNADAAVCSVPCTIVGLPALRKIDRDAPLVSVDTRRKAARDIRRNPLDVPIDRRIPGGDGRLHQRACIETVCREIVNERHKMLVEMATGTGKTRTAAALLKRLFEKIGRRAWGGATTRRRA
jgi:hypothetical protein